VTPATAGLRLQEDDVPPIALSVLSGNRVVFDIKGSRYRVLAQIAFGTQRVAILRAGTHAEYDRSKL
jgi:mRNA-degrading endonuclease HigB of HigAB toxin-antitoxin module